MRFTPVKKRISREGSSEPFLFSFEYIPFLARKTGKEKFSLPKHRSYIIMMFALIIGTVFFIKAFTLEIVEQKNISQIYEFIHQKKEWILPPRGLILDKKGVVLAQNAPGKKENEFARLYTEGPLFAPILGYIGRVQPYHLSRSPDYLPFDFIGQAGIEASYEKFLRGEHGSIEKPLLRKGAVPQSPVVTPAKPGNNITLTIDSDMQKKLYEVLEAQVKKFHAPGAAGIILNPNNGAVQALVSIPSFDNNTVDTRVLYDPAKPLFNRAIAGEYPSGSTIKPFLAAAALKEGIITPEKIVHDRGKIQVRSIYDPTVIWTFRGWKALGDVDMRRAIAMSSNIYFFSIGGGYGDIKGLGIKRLIQYLSLYGWNDKTGIDLVGEEKGFLPSPEWKKKTLNEDWFIGDTYNTSIGQGFLRITPLQLAFSTQALANYGTLYTPYLVDHITDQKGQTLFTHTPQIIRKNILNQSFIEIARQGMREAVEEGTVKRLNTLSLPVAAKTGTAQAGTGRPHHGWVTVFAPYEHPEIVLTILIENGEGGEQSAVPAAKEFLEWYFNEA